MPYYLRVFGCSDAVIPAKAIGAQAPSCELRVEDGDSDNWNQLTISHKDGTEILSIERNLVIEGELGAEELSEFTRDLQSARPASAAEWLRNYFRNVKVIYAAQLLSGTDINDGWKVVGAVMELLKSGANGLVHAEGEGFSNPDGYHITWEFSDKVSGPWSMAVLDEKLEWHPFRMELGDREQRREFQSGVVPAGAKRL